MSRFLSQWRGFDVPIKITVLVGFIAGLLGMISTILLSRFYPIDNSAPPLIPFALVASIISIAGSLCLLKLQLNRDQQGILALPITIVSFLVLYASLVSLTFLIYGTR